MPGSSHIKGEFIRVFAVSKPKTDRSSCSTINYQCFLDVFTSCKTNIFDQWLHNLVTQNSLKNDIIYNCKQQLKCSQLYDVPWPLPITSGKCIITSVMMAYHAYEIMSGIYVIMAWQLLLCHVRHMHTSMCHFAYAWHNWKWWRSTLWLQNYEHLFRDQ